MGQLTGVAEHQQSAQRPLLIVRLCSMQDSTQSFEPPVDAQCVPSDPAGLVGRIDDVAGALDQHGAHFVLQVAHKGYRHANKDRRDS